MVIVSLYGAVLLPLPQNSLLSLYGAVNSVKHQEIQKENVKACEMKLRPASLPKNGGSRVCELELNMLDIRQLKIRDCFAGELVGHR